MSTLSRYRSWEVAPVWSLGGGAAIFGGSRCSYRITGSGLVAEAPFQLQGQHDEMRMAVRRTDPHVAPTDPDDFRIDFTAGGVSPAGYPVGLSFSWGDCPSTGSRLWFHGSSLAAGQLHGTGMILDASGVVGAGGDLQVLGFNVGTNISRTVRTLESLLGAVRNWDPNRLRRLIPMGAVCFGVGFGLSVGFTVFEGAWGVSESNELTFTTRDTSVGRPLPAERRPRMGSTRSRQERAADAWRP